MNVSSNALPKIVHAITVVKLDTMFVFKASRTNKYKNTNKLISAAILPTLATVSDCYTTGRKGF